MLTQDISQATKPFCCIGLGHNTSIRFRTVLEYFECSQNQHFDILLFPLELVFEGLPMQHEGHMPVWTLAGHRHSPDLCLTLKSKVSFFFFDQQKYPIFSQLFQLGHFKNCSGHLQNKRGVLNEIVDSIQKVRKYFFYVTHDR